MAAKKTPEINGGSMADISFLMLIFFLMVTTMDHEEGLSRRLPPLPAENQQVQDTKVNRRNIIEVKINSNDKLFAGNQPMDVSQLKDKIKEFLTNPSEDPSLPEKTDQDIEGLGTVAVSKGVISLQNDRGTSYSKYIEVQNEIIKAVDELRDDFSMQRFGKKYAKLDEETQDMVKKAVPQNISEAEPKDVKKK